MLHHVASGCITFLFAVGMAAVISVPVYFLSGLFGPRLPENLNLNASEPSEAEFETQE
jgi:hypothetical protein